LINRDVVNELKKLKRQDASGNSKADYQQEKCLGIAFQVL